MGATAGFHPNDASGELGCQLDHTLAPQPATENDPTGHIQPHNAAAVLSKVNAEYGNG
jgi:hypothetical protein